MPRALCNLRRIESRRFALIDLLPAEDSLVSSDECRESQVVIGGSIRRELGVGSLGLFGH